MREIKFRAWNKITNHFSDFTNEHRISDINSSELMIFMQYTGLKDKNGVGIYEGDIVKGNYLKGIGVVEWNDKFCKFDISHKMNITPSDEFEVIGNIYENPELLKGIKKGAFTPLIRYHIS